MIFQSKFQSRIKSTPKKFFEIGSWTLFDNYVSLLYVGAQRMLSLLSDPTALGMIMSFLKIWMLQRFINNTAGWRKVDRSVLIKLIEPIYY